MILLTNWISLFWYLNMFLVMDSSIVESALVVVFYVFWEWRCACFFYAYFNFYYYLFGVIRVELLNISDAVLKLLF